MIKITILALTMPPSPMFEREFSRSIDADDYEMFWRAIGHCHVRRRLRP